MTRFSESYLGQVAGYLLSLGIEFLDEDVDVLTRFHFHHLSAHALRHGDELNERIGISDALDVGEVGHVETLLDVASVF